MTLRHREREVRGRLTALLGPTNTGKTHRAIERMLEFESGMMGLPLRLLAREVYDRVSARIGEQAVALVTGEEKRVPPRPRYWICTTEAMPLDLAVDFLAIDEVQLVAHPERGHVFTDRVLYARGEVETWFLGALTAESLLRAELPDLRVVRLPRLSRLVHKGQSSLRTLPRRSAVVAFSMPEVYELADALRRRRGGAAVVLGALSPRVRNAQVALYQAGEVDFLVATDAIGMGLNLDVEHVALAGTVKFDGFEVRELEAAELAQVVGRAGRYLRDGTFGTLAPEPELPRGLVQQLEQHRFPSLHFAYYRNSRLDFSSAQALVKSLEQRPPRPGLRAPPDADDLSVLRALVAKPAIARVARTPESLRTLWDVCRIPNYEKRIPEHQAERLVPLFEQLRRDGQIGADYIDGELCRLERYDGDIHALMDRLAAVRTFTYISHQGDWVASAPAFRARTRALEDQLSDALHQRLLDRFVEPRERRRGPTRARSLPAAHPFARLAELELAADGEARAAEGDWVERLIAAKYEDIALAPSGELTFEGARAGRLVRGPALLRPQLKLLLPDGVDAGARSRVERRLIAHTRDVVSALLEPVALGVVDSAPLRGLAYQLEQGLGTVQKRDAAAQLAALDDAERALLRERDIVVGKHTVFAAKLLNTESLAVREALCRAQLGRESQSAIPSTDVLYQRATDKIDRELALCVGFVVLQGWLLRCDLLERLAALAPEQAHEEAMLMLGAPEEDARALLRAIPRGRRRRRRPR